MLEPVDSLLSMNCIEKQADHQIVILIAPSHYRSDGPLARPLFVWSRGYWAANRRLAQSRLRSLMYRIPNGVDLQLLQLPNVYSLLTPFYSCIDEACAVTKRALPHRTGLRESGCRANKLMEVRQNLE